jgi:hypothetical protein
MPRVSVFGLDMDLATQQELVAAVRARWPEITTGLSDPRAIQSVLKQIIKDTLAWYRAQQAVPDVNLAIEAKRVELQVQQSNAADAARTLADTDIHVTAP